MKVGMQKCIPLFNSAFSAVQVYVITSAVFKCEACNRLNDSLISKYYGFNTHLDFSRKVKVFRDLCQNNSKDLMQQTGSLVA